MKYETADVKDITLNSASELTADTLCEVMGLGDPLDWSECPASAATGHVSDWLDIFNQEPRTSSHASSFISPESANHIHDVLERSGSMLMPFVNEQNNLPLSNNTWLTERGGTKNSGSARLSDRQHAWAIVAPVGSTLASALGGDARVVSMLLGQSHYDALENENPALRQMLLKAEEALSIDADRLSMAFVGSVLVNLLWRITEPPDPPEKHRQQQLENLCKELLDVIDTVALRDSSTVVAVAQCHLLHGERWRTDRLVKTRMKSHPDDVDVARFCASYRSMRSSRTRAIEECNVLASNFPEDAQITLHLCAAYRRRLEYGQAIQVLENAIDQQPNNASLRQARSRTQQLASWLDAASDTAAMPRVSLLDHERSSGQPLDETLALAAYLYGKHGTLLIENVFDHELLHKCKEQFLVQHEAYCVASKKDDALQIGDKRYQVSIAIDGYFNSPDFYANPFIVALMRRLLGKKPIIGSTVCATSLPGAKNQHLHKDHRALFTNNAEDTPIKLPSVAITTMIPLVELNDRTGSTLVKKGSHVLSAKASKALPSQIPNVPVGACYLMDMALSHQGLGNSSTLVRPIINMVYQRSWFADNKNFKLQRPLDISHEAYRDIPKEHRYLFDWADQPGASLDTRS